MTETTLTSGYGPLEIFFGAEEGVSLKAGDGTFVHSIPKHDGSAYIAFAKYKDESCKFIVESLGDSKVRLKDNNGLYLRRSDTERNDHSGWFPIRATQTTPDDSCEYLVFTRNGNVLFKSNNGLFVSRVSLGGLNTFEAAKSTADKCCEFGVDIGDLKAPVFEITSVHVSESFILDLKKVTVREVEFANKSSLVEDHRLTWEKNVTEVTTWKRYWGLNTAISIDTGYFASHFGKTLSYDGLQGTAISRKTAVKIGEEVKVSVPQGKSMIVKLVGIMDENADIPFTATIKKTKANGQIERLTESGRWQGVVCDRYVTKICKKTCV